MIRKKYKINFLESRSPICEPVTKFGGQPVWVESQMWPLSRSTRRPMTFVGQVALPQEIFDNVEPTMAYIFMSDFDDQNVERTWELNAGENAVVIQPNGRNCETMPLENGPSISVWKKIPGEKLRKPFPCEFAVELSEAFEEEEEIDQDLEFENKIGGSPQFLQYEEFPDDNKGNWRLLLQLDSCKVPFEINFGDAGVGYAFISNDGKEGKFLWQSC